MVNRQELRDPAIARTFLLQGLWLQHMSPPRPVVVSHSLKWALELAAEGLPLLPLGVVADIGRIIFLPDAVPASPRNSERLELPGLPPTLMRSYEDYFLGKLYADWTFGRASDALRQYQNRDQARGLAYLIEQFRERAGLPSVDLNPAVVKALIELSPDAVVREGWDSFQRGGVLPLLVSMYETMTAACRRCGDILAPRHVESIEKRLILAEFSQRLALDQVLHAADSLSAALPEASVRPISRRHDVSTQLFDEDAYPVGGFASISTHGSLESLLHSQLAYMEKEERPDLFDVKFLRDELLYYSRDENQFLRRRRTLVFLLHHDLVQARFKDAALPYQRIVLSIAFLLVAVRKFSDWLGNESLQFEILFVGKSLEPEQQLLAMLLRDSISSGIVRMARLPTLDAVARRVGDHTRRSLCQVLSIAMKPTSWLPEGAEQMEMLLDGPTPSLGDDDECFLPAESTDPWEAWSAALHWLIERWL